MTDERGQGAVEPGPELEIGGDEAVSWAYIPCPVCRAPIRLEHPAGELSHRITCPTCTTLLER